MKARDVFGLMTMVSVLLRIICSGHQWGCGQSCGFINSNHKVHILHRLPGCAFDQIIFDRQYNNSVSVLRSVYGDAAYVRPTNRPGIRETVERHYVDERFVLIA